MWATREAADFAYKITAVRHLDSGDVFSRSLDAIGVSKRARAETLQEIIRCGVWFLVKT